VVTYPAGCTSSTGYSQTTGQLCSVGTTGTAATTVSPTTTTTTTTTSSTYSYKFYNPLNVGSSGADVTALQQRLASEGIYSGPITGYYGSLTEAAVKQYQGLHNLEQLGNVGPGTRADLNNGL
jgi:peptidoglycan hydrolase-like protein with peptidoglycan-binding domain